MSSSCQLPVEPDREGDVCDDMKSGLQKRVLGLYRDLLRTARDKDPSLDLSRTGKKIPIFFLI
jgi:hypothetical protein